MDKTGLMGARQDIRTYHKHLIVRMGGEHGD